MRSLALWWAAVAPAVWRKLESMHGGLEVEVVQDHASVKVDQQGPAIWGGDGWSQRAERAERAEG